jgi:hypothetical protein
MQAALRPSLSTGTSFGVNDRTTVIDGKAGLLL